MDGEPDVALPAQDFGAVPDVGLGLLLMEG